MPDEQNEPLPQWLVEALTALPWEEVRVQHLPLRLKPGLAERDARIAELESRVAELEGVVEAIMLEYEDETPRDADVACDRMARLARAALGPKVVAKDPKPLRPLADETPET